MAGEVIIGAAVGATALYLWGWRRFKYVRAYWRNHKRAEEFERALREAREDYAALAYRAATDADGELRVLLAASDGDCRALEASSFTALGEIVMQPADKPATAIMRAFVDQAGTTSAIVGVTRKTANTVLTFISYVGDDVFMTRRGTGGMLAEPPTMHRQNLTDDLLLLIDRHRTFAPLDNALRLATRDELLSQHAKTRASIVRWRDAQAPDELLDADLRCVLGDLYPKVGKAWARRLRGKLPEATLRRSS
jgi:hypothetical protein